MVPTSLQEFCQIPILCPFLMMENVGKNPLRKVCFIRSNNQSWIHELWFFSTNLSAFFLNELKIIGFIKIISYIGTFCLFWFSNQNQIWIGRLKQASNFVKMFRIRRFVNSGLVTWSDELVQSFCVWGCQKCWFSTNWTFYFRQFSPKNLDAHRRCKIQGTPRSRHCKRLVFQKKNM